MDRVVNLAADRVLDSVGQPRSDGAVPAQMQWE
jgi:hypothetical protein